MYTIETDKGLRHTPALVIATGGLSIPKMGATPFGYKIAEQFNKTMSSIKGGVSKKINYFLILQY